jgi:hypothetical protein
VTAKANSFALAHANALSLRGRAGCQALISKAPISDEVGVFYGYRTPLRARPVVRHSTAFKAAVAHWTRNCQSRAHIRTRACRAFFFWIYVSHFAQIYTELKIAPQNADC